MPIIQKHKTISSAIFFPSVFEWFSRNFFYIPKIAINTIINQTNQFIRYMIQTSYTIECISRNDMICSIIKDKNKPLKPSIQQRFWPWFIDRSKITKNLMNSENNFLTTQKTYNPTWNRSSIGTCMDKINRQLATKFSSQPYSREKKRKSSCSSSIYIYTIQWLIPGQMRKKARSNNGNFISTWKKFMSNMLKNRLCTSSMRCIII